MSVLTAERYQTGSNGKPVAHESTTYVGYCTPAFDKLPLEQRLAALFDGGYSAIRTPLNERKATWSNNRLYELDLATHSPIGSFKFGGAWNSVASVEYHRLLSHGVVASSAGNHALGVACAVRRYNELLERGKFSNPNGQRVKAVIYVPTTAAPVKIQQIKETGGDDVDLRLEGNSYDEAYEAAQKKLLHIPGATFIHPYDSEKTATGQRYVGIQLLRQISQEQLEPSNCVIVLPVGGGGLLYGVASTLEETFPDAQERPKLVIAQLEGADSAINSWYHYKNTGELKAIAVGDRANPLADGASVNQLGDFGLSVLPLVDDVVRVTNKQLAQGYKRTLDGIYKELSVVYGMHGIDPFYGLQEPASMIGEVGADIYSNEFAGKTVINLKTGINYNPDLIEKIMNC